MDTNGRHIETITLRADPRAQLFSKDMIFLCKKYILYHKILLSLFHEKREIIYKGPNSMF